MIKDKKKLNELIECVRDSLDPTVVCDADFKCLGWQNGMKQIESAQIFMAAHGIECSYQAFKFCPWCGKKIIGCK